MNSKKIVFLGTKPTGYNCLAYLISQISILNIQIIGLLTRGRKEFGNAHDLEQLAKDNNIPLFEKMNDIPPCDIIYSVQYNEILKQEHISKASQIAVNLHMAPLPEYRGSNQFSCAILDKKKEFGTTIHMIDTRIDHGDILFQKRFPIPENCWVTDLYQITTDASVKIFQQTLKNIVEGNYTPLPQESLVAKYGSNLHFKKDINRLKEIDLNWDKEKIELYVRATSMPGFEPPFCIINGEKIYLTKNYTL